MSSGTQPKRGRSKVALLALLLSAPSVLVLLVLWVSRRDAPSTSPSPQQASIARASAARGAQPASERGAVTADLSQSESGAAAESPDEIVPASFQQAVELRRGERLFARFQAEAADREWTGFMREHMDTELRRLGLRADVTSLECRTTLCRVTLQFASARAADNLFLVEPPQGSEIFPSARVAGGAFIATLYVGATGVRLKHITETVVR